MQQTAARRSTPATVSLSPLGVALLSVQVAYCNYDFLFKIAQRFIEARRGEWCGSGMVRVVEIEGRCGHRDPCRDMHSADRCFVWTSRAGGALRAGHGSESLRNNVDRWVWPDASIPERRFEIGMP